MLYLIRFLNMLLPLLYLMLSGLYLAHFSQGYFWARRHLTWLLPATLGLHMLEILLRGLHGGYFPISSIFEAAAVLSFALTLVYFAVERFSRIDGTGPFFVIPAFLLQLFSSAFIEFSAEIPEVLSSPMFIVHTSAAMLGYAALFSAGIYGSLYLLLFYDIRSSRYGVIYRRLPALEQLSELNSRAVLLGFVFLTIAIFQGILWRKSLWPDSGHFDPQVVFAYAVWIIFGATILGHRLAHWSGKWLAISTLGGVGLIGISLVVVNFVVSSFHRFY